MRKPIVEVDSLVKQYGTLNAFDEISFRINEGDVFAFLGPTGAGKTTTVEVLECLRPLTSGTAKIFGYDVTRDEDEKEIKKRIGVLPQEYSALDKLTFKENIDLIADMYKKHLDTAKMIELLDLKDKTKERFENLSGGLKQRVGIACALINDPQLVFLDEPTTGLDPKARRDVWSVIQNLKQLGKTVFLTTHYMDEAQVLANQVAIIDKGKISAIGSPEELITQYGGLKVLIIRDGDKKLARAIAFPMMFLSGTFFPLELMSSYIQTIAKALPLTYFSEGLKYSMLYKYPEGICTNMAIIAILAVVFKAIGAFVTRWKAK
jgi:ABC-2 type transport system ATP-binding protein